MKLNKSKLNPKKIINNLNKNGYCIIEDVLDKKKCDETIKNIEKNFKKISKNKHHIDERRSKFGQETIRDLVLRDPKNFLYLIDKKEIMHILENIFKENFILDNCMASNSINKKKKYFGLVHIDSHLPCKSINETSDVVVCYCLDEFTKENGSTKVWPKSHLSGIRIHKDKNYSKKIKKNFKYAEAKKGSLIIFLGQTWHQIGKNLNSKRRWGVLCHYKRWWIKPSTDWTKCGPVIYKLLNKKQKELFGFTSISPKFNFKKNSRVLKTLRKSSTLNNEYFKAIQY